MAGTLWGYLDPAEHAVMLLDERRVAPYARAIAATVRPGDVVLDVGTGTGIMALLAARAGARRVFAVERTGIEELARRHVADNGLGGVVEVIRAELADLDALPEPPRIVVGEILGHFAPAEGQHRAYAIARRLAAPGAVMIPARYRLVLGAVRATGLRADLARLADLHGVRLTTLAARLAQRPAFVHLDPDELLGPEVEGDAHEVDAPPPAAFGARVAVDRDGDVGGVSCGFVAELAPGIALRTAIGAPRTVWTQTVFPVDPPLPVRAGDVLDVEIVPRIVTNHATWAWTVARGGELREGDATRSYSGGRDDLLAQLRVRARGPAPPPRATAALCGWAAALGAPLAPGDPVDVDAMARRALAALPGRYPSLAEARQDVLALLAAADRAGS